MKKNYARLSGLFGENYARLSGLNYARLSVEICGKPSRVYSPSAGIAGALGMTMSTPRAVS